MKRKAKLFITLMVVAFLWGLSFCQLARADYWQSTGSLLPGTYMLTYIDESATASSLALDEWAQSQGDKPNVKMTKLGNILVLEFDKDYNTDGFVEFLNNDPQTTPSQNPTLFKRTKPCRKCKKDGDGWVQIPLPCDWKKGDASTKTKI